MGLRLHLVRHGETVANQMGLIQGQTDYPLTPKGKELLIHVGELLKNIRFHSVFSSDLGRARTSTDLLVQFLDYRGPVTFTKELREIDFGDYSRLSKTEIMEKIRFHKQNDHIPYPNGESGADLKKRVKGFVERVLQSTHLEEVLVVTHYGVIETMIRSYTDLGADREFRFDPNSLAILRFEDQAAAFEQIRF